MDKLRTDDGGHFLFTALNISLTRRLLICSMCCVAAPFLLFTLQSKLRERKGREIKVKARSCYSFPTGLTLCVVL